MYTSVQVMMCNCNAKNRLFYEKLNLFFIVCNLARLQTQLALANVMAQSKRVGSSEERL